MHSTKRDTVEDARSLQYLPRAGVTAVLEIGPFAPGPEAWPALSFRAAYRAERLWLDGQVREEH